MVTAGNYINELNSKDTILCEKIAQCKSILKSKQIKGDASYLNEINANLSKFRKEKELIEKELHGMHKYKDDHGAAKNVLSSGWRRWLPERLKGYGYCRDSRDEHDSLAHTGATQDDFEYW